MTLAKTGSEKVLGYIPVAFLIVAKYEQAELDFE